MYKVQRGRIGIDKEYTLLTGGDSSDVFSNGKDVHRDLKPQSPIVHRLLNHLASKQCDFSPRFSGIKNGREVLSFMSGETIDHYPRHNSLEEKKTIIRSSAKLLRKYHDAASSFHFKETDTYFLRYDGSLPKEVMCHNDFAPYNITFEKGQAIGLIDFDTICPAPRAWDIAYALYRFVPLNQMVYDHSLKEYRKYTNEDGQEYRLAVNEFLTAYGYDDSIDLLEVVIERLESLICLFEEECKKGNQAFILMKEQGHQAFYKTEVAFIRKYGSSWF